MSAEHDAVIDRIRTRVLGPEGQGHRAVFLDGVRDKAGMMGTRTADGISMGLWPSRGLLIEGYEVKVSRGDWLGELKDPSKAEAIAQWCDRFWLVVKRDVLQPGELPANWGLLICHGRGLKCEKEAPELDRNPLAPEFVAAMLRRAVKQDLAAERSTLRAEMEADFRYSGGPAQLERERTSREYAEKELERISAIWEEFRELTGEDFQRWMIGQPEEAKTVAEILLALRSHDRTRDEWLTDLRRREERALKVAETFTKARKLAEEAVDDRN